MSTLRPEIIVAAIEGFESQKARLDQQIRELRAMIGGASPESTATLHNGGRRHISAAARRRMTAGQRRRWAAARSTAEPAVAASKGKRRLSAAGRAAMVAALTKLGRPKRLQRKSLHEKGFFRRSWHPERPHSVSTSARMTAAYSLSWVARDCVGARNQASRCTTFAPPTSWSSEPGVVMPFQQLH